MDSGNIVTEITIPISQSEDARVNDILTEQGHRELDLGGRWAEDVWEIMKQQAINIHNAEIDSQSFFSK